MVGFLRRKSSPKAKPGTDTGVTVSKKSTSSSNPPPALPPLFHSRTSKSSSSPHGPEPDVAPSSSQPGPSKEDIPAGASTSPVLLPTVAPLTTSIEDDVDWQALIQFIDAPALLSDSTTKPSQEATPPPAAEKKLPGAALVTSNRYLSQAQKTRLAREQSSKLNNARPKVHKDEPLALPLLFNGSPKNNGSNVTPTSTFLIAPDSFTDRRDVRTTPLVKEDPQGRAGPDPGAQGDGKTGGVSDCVRVFLFPLFFPDLFPLPLWTCYRGMRLSRRKTDSGIGYCRVDVGKKVGVLATPLVPTSPYIDITSGWGFCLAIPDVQHHQYSDHFYPSRIRSKLPAIRRLPLLPAKISQYLQRTEVVESSPR
ncbi:hypothetical protein V8B97DRAFT_665286 [Scleroderma yunnanense]